MATYTTTEAAAGAAALGHGFAGNVKAAVGSLELGTALANNDVLQFCKVPAQAVVFGGWLMGDDLDTGTETLDIDIGWAANGTEAADPDGFGNFGVITGDAVTGIKPEVSIWLPLGGVLRTGGPQLFSAETRIEGDVNANPNAGGTGTLTLVVLYFINENFAKTSVS